MENYYIFCACGCGEKLLKFHPIWKHQRKYVDSGHVMRGRKNSLSHIKNRVDSFKSKHHKFIHTQVTKDKIAFFQTGRKKSQGMVDRLTRFAKARGKVAFKYGHFYSNKNNKKMFHRSSYELQAFKILEQMDVVDKYMYEPFAINYQIDGKTYIYHPDLLVIYKNGDKQIIEIKPKGELDDIVNIKKFEGANKFCLDKNLSFNVWTEDILFKDNSLNAFMKKVANSEKPLLNCEVTPNQAENINSLACVETYGQPPKGMIESDTPTKDGDYR